MPAAGSNELNTTGAMDWRELGTPANLWRDCFLSLKRKNPFSILEASPCELLLGTSEGSESAGLADTETGAVGLNETANRAQGRQFGPCGRKACGR